MVVGDKLIEHILKIGLWINAVDATAVQQSVGNRTFLTRIGVTDKHPVLRTNLGGAKLGFKQVGVQSGVTVLKAFP